MMYSHTVFLETPYEQLEQQTLGFVDHELSARVILYNDEEHTFDEVIIQIMKATGCTLERAEVLTLEVHRTGKAMVFSGGFTECLRVSGILEEIGLMTQIET